MEREQDGTEPDEYGLVMPFVSTASQGGPHDDDSYVAGYEMGQLDAFLGEGSPAVHEQQIHAENGEQGDLIGHAPRLPRRDRRRGSRGLAAPTADQGHGGAMSEAADRLWTGHGPECGPGRITWCVNHPNLRHRGFPMPWCVDCEHWLVPNREGR